MAINHPIYNGLLSGNITSIDNNYDFYNQQITLNEEEFRRIMRDQQRVPQGVQQQAMQQPISPSKPKKKKPNKLLLLLE